MDDQVIEQILKASNKTAPRVTAKDIDDNIVDIEIVKHVTKGGKILRWAVLTTASGFAVTGKPSASVSVENDTPIIGETVAIENAKSEMWALMGYHLSCKLAAI